MNKEIQEQLLDEIILESEKQYPKHKGAVASYKQSILRDRSIFLRGANHVVINIMQSYAATQAVDFAKWISKEEYTVMNNDIWESPYTIKVYNTEQLYEIYLKNMG